MDNFSFEIVSRDVSSRARAGIIHTAHGDIETPYVVPVATCASVKSLDSGDLDLIGAQCALANTYHLFLRPGDSEIKKLGGIQKFMHFPKPMFTDSGGYQAFSLGLGKVHGVGKIGHLKELPKTQESTEVFAKVSDSGVSFRSVYDGSKHFINPEISMKIQANLGADIIMAFDECTSPLSDKAYTKQAMERTHRWALDSLRFHDPKQALYGIIQGGFYQDLRDISTKFILSQSFDGIAIGGSLGSSKFDAYKIVDWVSPLLDDRPRHLLGIGQIDDVFECISRGIDTFDCVEMTRVARRGQLYISPEAGGSRDNKFRISIKTQRFADR